VIEGVPFSFCGGIRRRQGALIGPIELFVSEAPEGIGPEEEKGRKKVKEAGEEIRRRKRKHRPTPGQ
jgi:hypothetical protein